MECLAKDHFPIAFENRLAPGWTTEKFTDPFEVFSIPIYWGDSRALQWFNPKAFVNVSDFRNFSECCDYILHLENSQEDYARMLMEPPRPSIAKVRFRPEPGSRRRTATKPVQDEPIWESSKLFKTLYNCFTIENDTAMPRFGRGVYALW